MESLRITPLDDSAVQEGAWTTYRGVRLKIARANNPKFKNMFMRLMKPHQKNLNSQALDKLDEDTMRDIMCKCMSEAILTDWGDFAIGGDEVPFTKENAYSLLFNDEDCRQYVIDFSNDVDNYLTDEEESLAGKS